jgi:serine/threonine protein kinase
MAAESNKGDIIPDLRGLTVVRQVGNGAGSVVFEAKDDLSGEHVAVKSVTRAIVIEIQEHAPSPEFGGNIAQMVRVYVSQVRNEWRLGHRLTNLAGGHVGIPRMRELVVERDFFARTRGIHLVMDFAAGRNLRKGHNYSIAEIVDIYRKAADILRFMHQNNVVHADMKPHHIIVADDGKIQLLDLGLACKRHGHAAQVVGSPHYMAPEQLVGAGVDERTDVFGLGATMFWALTGRTIRPTVAGGTAGVLDFQIKTFETSVREHNPEVPPALEDIVLRSCAPSRSARLSLSEVITRLDRLTVSLGPSQTA